MSPNSTQLKINFNNLSLKILVQFIVRTCLDYILNPFSILYSFKI